MDGNLVAFSESTIDTRGLHGDRAFDKVVIDMYLYWDDTGSQQALTYLVCKSWRLSSGCTYILPTRGSITNYIMARDVTHYTRTGEIIKHVHVLTTLQPRSR